MKKLIVTLLIIPIFSLAQVAKLKVNSIQDYENLMNYAKLENRPVIIDFVADWCAPCKTMDKELWRSDEFRGLKNYFFIEVDIDKNSKLARKYGIIAIPRVIVEVANDQKDILIDKTGFLNKNQHLNDLQYINQFDFKEVYTAKNEIESGIAYRNLFITDIEKKHNILLKLSSKYFKKALKKEENNINQLNIIYNLKLKGSSKKAIKNLEKLKLNKSSLSIAENEIIDKIVGKPY